VAEAVVPVTAGVMAGGGPLAEAVVPVTAVGGKERGEERRRHG
jgi:hypothetical protein